MKNKSILYIVGLLLLFSGHGLSQNYVCYGDSVYLVKPAVRGYYYWQKSLNGQDWTDLSGISGDTLFLIPDTSMSYRLSIEEGDCAPFQSSEVRLQVVEIPILSIPSIQPVCVNAEPFDPGPGNPAGGIFKGQSIVDGKFLPSIAEAGSNTYYYVYQDSASACADSIQGTIDVIPLPDTADAGEDQFLVITDSVVLTGNQITVGEGEWRIVSGNGGRFKNPANPETVFFRTEGYDTFVLEWTISNECAAYSDQVTIEFAETSKNPCPDEPFVFDADGNRYKTVQVGDQCWMAENLRVGTYVPSTIRDRPHSNLNNNGITEFYSWGNNTDSLDVYGGLYDWDELMGYPDQNENSQDVCPEGWHVPTQVEWEKLNDYFVDKDAGRQLMPDSTAGFDAYYSGDRHAYGSFVSKGASGFFWTSTDYRYNGANLAYYYEIVSCSDYLQWGRFSKLTGLSVRCLKNEN